MTDQTRTDLQRKTDALVLEWLRLEGGRTDATATEAVARWMRDSLRIGGIKACREIVATAINATLAEAKAMTEGAAIELTEAHVTALRWARAAEAAGFGRAT